MPAIDYATIWVGTYSASYGVVEVGACVIPDEDRVYLVKATRENRTALGRTKAASGIARTMGSFSSPSMHVQTVGPCEPEITGLGPGPAAMLRVADNGRLERIVTPSADDVLAGSCDEDGWANLNFSGASGPAGPQGEQGIQGPKGDTGDPGLPDDLAAGDLFYFDGAALARIPTAGVPDGYVLTASGGVPVWAEPPAPPPGEEPVLVSHNFSLADTMGGDEITSTVEHLTVGTTVAVGGVSALVVSIDVGEGKIAWTMPERPAGLHNVVVTTSAGASNALPIRAWAPTPDCDAAEDVTLCFDPVHTPYDPDDERWLPRYSIFPLVDAALNWTYRTQPAPSQVNGAPSFPGAGMSGGLITNAYVDGGTMSNYFGGGRYSAGSLAAVLSSTNTDEQTSWHYLSPFAVGNYTCGLSVTTYPDDPTFYIRSTNYAAGYVLVEVESSRDEIHSVVSRWGMGSSAVELSIDGALSGAGFGSTDIFGGTDLNWAASFNAGLSYPSGSAADQKFSGTIRAFVVLKSKASDTFIQRFHEWSRVHLGAGS